MTEPRASGAPIDGMPAAALLRHEHPVARVAFSPNGRLLATGSGEGNVGTAGEARVWDVATGDAVSPVMWHGNRVVALEFSTDGRSLLTASRGDNAARIWSIAPSSQPRNELGRLVARTAGSQVDATGSLRPAPTERDVTNPDAVAAGPTEILGWHEFEAVDALSERRWAAAVPHLDFLVKAAPHDYAMPARRGGLFSSSVVAKRRTATYCLPLSAARMMLWCGTRLQSFASKPETSGRIEHTASI